MSALAGSATPTRATVAGVEVPTDHFIGGEWVASESRFDVNSPIDQSVIAQVSRAGEEEVDRAVRAAADAFPAWAGLGPAGRAQHLHRLADAIEANVDRLAAVECADMAMLLESLRLRVIARGALNYRSYADLAAQYEERDWHSKGTWNRVQRMPAGPAAVITPWNAPFMLSTWKPGDARLARRRARRRRHRAGARGHRTDGEPAAGPAARAR
ncbi:MAG TPA: aldehyde dehydrogenase family protein, partial [Conexibacter sp.]|nr:aldehyde dehydrogenase family protein [Conexibacter sp.]